ncbi:hypothetical protein PWT90_10877 [Aphanocladium album]|nr:hypothetical protein PWT90_10877 [Aphanocladium album]
MAAWRDPVPEMGMLVPDLTQLGQPAKEVQGTPISACKRRGQGGREKPKGVTLAGRGAAAGADGPYRWHLPNTDEQLTAQGEPLKAAARQQTAKSFWIRLPACLHGNSAAANYQPIDHTRAQTDLQDSGSGSGSGRRTQGAVPPPDQLLSFTPQSFHKTSIPYLDAVRHLIVAPPQLLYPTNPPIRSSKASSPSALSLPPPTKLASRLLQPASSPSTTTPSHHHPQVTTSSSRLLLFSAAETLAPSAGIPETHRHSRRRPIGEIVINTRRPSSPMTSLIALLLRPSLPTPTPASRATPAAPFQPSH